MNKYKFFLTLLTLAIILILININIFDQKKVDNKINEELVCDYVSLQEKVNLILKNKDLYNQELVDIFGQSSQGGTQITYTYSGNVVIVEQIFYTETGKSEVVYFFENKKHIAIHKNNIFYELPLYIDSSGKIKYTENKIFYFDTYSNICAFFKNNERQYSISEQEKETVNYVLSTIIK